jgi:hypothetical protein
MGERNAVLIVTGFRYASMINEVVRKTGLEPSEVQVSDALEATRERKDLILFFIVPVDLVVENEKLVTDLKEVCPGCKALGVGSENPFSTKELTARGVDLFLPQPVNLMSFRGALKDAGITQ